METVGSTLTKAILPLPVFTKGRGDKRRDILVSINNWLPMHYIVKNNVKKAYHKVAEEWIKTLPKYKTLTPHYTLYFKDKRKKDIDNYTFPLHKFLMDAMVEYGALEDDNYDYVTGMSTSFGGVDGENYVVVELVGEYEDRN
jgi:hypothetical protein